jgi:uncharacterized protein DUF2628
MIRRRVGRIDQDQVMPTYEVFEPPMRNRGAADHADRFVFVRDGFSISAFLFGPLWMLYRRLWLVLIIYLGIMAALEVGLVRLGIGAGSQVAVAFLVALLIGIEAASLRRWTLLRRGWLGRGVVVAGDREMAERRFFDARSADAARAQQPAPTAEMPGTIPASPADPGVIGLFPEPSG